MGTTDEKEATFRFDHAMKELCKSKEKRLERAAEYCRAKVFQPLMTIVEYRRLQHELFDRPPEKVDTTTGRSKNQMDFKILDFF